MNYGAIKKNDIANGVGVRVSLFVSGCTHHCKECFNPETWNFDYGAPFTREVEDEIIEALNHDYIAGLTVLGGEPMEPVNQRALVSFYRRVRKTSPKKTVWVYTGYTFDRDLIEGGAVHTDVTDEILSMTDVLVDGEFMIEKKNITLKFRGSENQRVIDVKASLAAEKTILVNLD